MIGSGVFAIVLATISSLALVYSGVSGESFLARPCEDIQIYNLSDKACVGISTGVFMLVICSLFIFIGVYFYEGWVQKGMLLFPSISALSVSGSYYVGTHHNDPLLMATVAVVTSAILFGAAYFYFYVALNPIRAHDMKEVDVNLMSVQVNDVPHDGTFKGIQELFPALGKEKLTCGVDKVARALVGAGTLDRISFHEKAMITNKSSEEDVDRFRRLFLTVIPYISNRQSLTHLRRHLFSRLLSSAIITVPCVSKIDEQPGAHFLVVVFWKKQRVLAVENKHLSSRHRAGMSIISVPADTIENHVYLRRSNMIITGKAGVGKTHIAKRLERHMHVALCLGSNLAARVTGMPTLEEFFRMGKQRDTRAYIESAYKVKAKREYFTGYFTTILVDEAFTIRNGLVLDLIRATRRISANVRWVLFGDPYQAGSCTDARDLMRELTSDAYKFSVLKMDGPSRRCKSKFHSHYIDVFEKYRMVSVMGNLAPRIIRDSISDAACAEVLFKMVSLVNSKCRLREPYHPNFDDLTLCHSDEYTDLLTRLMRTAPQHGTVRCGQSVMFPGMEVTFVMSGHGIVRGTRARVVRISSGCVTVAVSPKYNSEVAIPYTALTPLPFKSASVACIDDVRGLTISTSVFPSRVILYSPPRTIGQLHMFLTRVKDLSNVFIRDNIDVKGLIAGEHSQSE